MAEESRVFKYAEPPIGLQDKGKWEPLQYWVEGIRGAVLMVECEACNATYFGQWQVVKSEEGQDLVVPVLDGGLIHRKGYHPWACQCAAGRRWRKLYPVASDGLMESMRQKNRASQPQDRTSAGAWETDEIHHTSLADQMVRAASKDNVLKALEFLVLEGDPAGDKLGQVQASLQEQVVDGKCTVPEALALWHVAIGEMLEAARNLWRSKQPGSSVPSGT